MARPWREAVSCTRSITMASIVLELFPFITFSCPENYFCSADAIVMKFHPWTEYGKRKHHA